MAGKIIFHGLKKGLINRKVCVLTNNKTAGTFNIRDDAIINIEQDCVLSIKRRAKHSNQRWKIEDGMITEILCDYNFFTGKFILKLISKRPYDESCKSIDFEQYII